MTKFKKERSIKQKLFIFYYSIYTTKLLIFLLEMFFLDYFNMGTGKNQLKSQGSIFSTQTGFQTTALCLGENKCASVVFETLYCVY